eukprot:TRINITY_DN1664_c0_g1_i1.p1 TRINITY_DN1664_c0_g1~~TRINITY_DN1664_c0_g1_i1.p1  ORF type:complete len:309 (-),score=154.46 TRINITY_DN1664_c0_g1_i1:199-1080(-)
MATNEQSTSIPIPLAPPPPPLPQPQLQQSILTSNIKQNNLDNLDSNSNNIRIKSDKVARLQKILNWRTGRGGSSKFEMQIEQIPITINQKPGKEVIGESTGFTVWDCAIVLSKYLEWNYGGSNKTNKFDNEMILEVGSGTGLLGIVCGLIFENSKFILTDQLPLLELIEQNVDVNTQIIPKLKNRISVQELNWGENANHLQPRPPFRWIIVCECVYVNLPAKPLVDSLILLSDENTRILMAYEHRCDYWRRYWFDELASPHFEFERIPQEKYHPDYQADDIELYIIKKKINKQ